MSSSVSSRRLESVSSCTSDERAILQIQARFAQEKTLNSAVFSVVNVGGCQSALRGEMLSNL
eukprot:4797873-Alexandrium_andersonii.AAC.1